ncbi:hypothetical protein [Massilia pseudoviolaceinigra]|uniref:hypothetical protein n=1 Tax=Massilia pseudoviolaceinigra TaxID=3057165 RepID=UPI002796C6F8|nr:hypothetical protein [Massilia sp. CCM 9206]MDQ1921689.1 hypothetical protein [Massilia sp. CCM 9206]
MSADAPLDHGMLNLPLAKRSNIDAQLDGYKADQRALAASAAKTRAAETRALKAAAKIALADLKAAPGLLEQKAQKIGCTRAALVVRLLDWSKWEPKRVIKAKAEWMPA